MNKDDMLKMFGLADKPDPPKPINTPPIRPAPPNRREYTSAVCPTCFELDEWDLAKGKQLRKHHTEFESLSDEAMADFHTAFYAMDPELVEACHDKQRHEFLRELMDTPDYAELHQTTRLSTVASSVAARNAATEYLKLGNQRQRDRTPKGTKERPDGDGGPLQIAVLRAIAKACKGAKDEVEEMQEILSAIGMPGGMGGDGGDSKESIQPERIANAFSRVRNDRLLRRICELAGRYRRMAQARQRQKAIHGFDDMVGVELSGDVGRLLPIELAQLNEPEFEMGALRRIVERQALSREYRGIERVGKGPIIVCVDESGSMNGDPVCNAKAFALSMAWIARHQQRWCALVGYSGATQGTRLILPPNKWDEIELMNWLVHFFGCGTDMDVPLKELPDWWNDFIKAGMKRGKTDVILITDAECHVPNWLEQRFNEWKTREKVKCYSLVIGSTGESLRKVSDEIYPIDGVSLQEAGVLNCLSI